MANDFSGDPNCVACWDFEGTMNVDKLGIQANLTDYNTVTPDTTNYKEGAKSAYFGTGWECFGITDANVSSDFPLKNGGANTLSFCFWIRPTFNANIIGKVSSSVGFLAGFSGNKLTVTLYADATHVSTVQFATQCNLASARWYHVGFTFNGSDKSYQLRIWDDSANDYLGSDVTGTAANAPGANAGDFTIGAQGGYMYLLANLDELVVFNRVLSVDEIDAIRQGNFPIASGGAILINPDLLGGFTQRLRGGF